MKKVTLEQVVTWDSILQVLVIEMIDMIFGMILQSHGCYSCLLYSEWFVELDMDQVLQNLIQIQKIEN